MKATTIQHNGHEFKMANYKECPELSDDSTSFTARLFIDDDCYIAAVHDRGNGGGLEILPSGIWPQWLKSIDIEEIVDMLLEQRYADEFIRKNRDKGIMLKRNVKVLGADIPEYSLHYYKRGRKTVKISELIAAGYLDRLKADADKLRGEGFQVLNPELQPN